MVTKSFRKKILYIFLIIVAVGYQIKEISQENDSNLSSYSIREPQSEQEQLGCFNMFEQYCSALYSEKHQGNLKIGSQQDEIQILQGTTINGIPHTFYRYALAKLSAQNYLPKDMKKVLDDDQYFEKLQNYIRRPSREKMNLDERVSYDKMNLELGQIWTSAISETILRRVEKQMPGQFHKAEHELSIESQILTEKIRRNLNSEISKKIWSHDSNWKNVIKRFNEIKESYLILFSKLQLPSEIKNKWIHQIQTLKVLIPGEIPDIADDDCSATQANAFYYSHLNVITVCAGDFNSEDITETIAHEMAHSLDVNSTFHNFLMNSNLGKNMLTLRQMVCSSANSKFDCKSWDEFKAHYEDQIVDIKKYQHDLKEFQQCLQVEKNLRSIEKNDFESIALTSIKKRFSYLAGRSTFMNLIKKENISKSGLKSVNKFYLNPCEYFYWTNGSESLSDDFYSLAFFVAEYQCQENKTEKERFSKAIDISQSMSQRILEEIMMAEGVFSNSEDLQGAGYSSSPIERFADVMSSYALKEFYSKISLEKDRRNHFLASSSWLCEEPSLSSHYPDEDDVERSYVLESHAGNQNRLKEILSTPLREVLNCHKDFDWNECRIEDYLK